MKRDPIPLPLLPQPGTAAATVSFEADQQRLKGGHPHCTYLVLYYRPDAPPDTQGGGLLRGWIVPGQQLDALAESLREGEVLHVSQVCPMLIWDGRAERRLPCYQTSLVGVAGPANASGGCNVPPYPTATSFELSASPRVAKASSLAARSLAPVRSRRAPRTTHLRLVRSRGQRPPAAGGSASNKRSRPVSGPSSAPR